MSEPKFKVGDRVRHLPEYASHCPGSIPAGGKVYTVNAIDPEDDQSGAVYYFDEEGGASFEYRLELAEPAPEPKNPNPKKAFGAQKPDLALIPPVALLHMAMAFENGAARYGAFNWRKDPVEAMTYLAAQMRHAGLFLDGQDYSSDAMVHNLGHAMACCAILLDSQELGILIDNRPSPGKSEEVQQRLKKQKMEAGK